MVAEATEATRVESRSYQFLTPERKIIILEAIAHGYTLTTAARKAGVSRYPVYDHMQSDADFRIAIERARTEGLDTVVDLVRENAGDLRRGFLDRIAWLKAHDRERWGDHVDVRTTSTLRIEVVAVPSAVELLSEDARLANLALPEPQSVRDNIIEGEYSEVYDADSST